MNSIEKDPAKSGAKVPFGHTMTSLLGLGPIPFTKIVATHAMVAEANRDATRGSSTQTDGVLSDQESAVRADIIKTSQRRLDKAVTGTIEPLIKQVKALHAEINIIDRMLLTHRDRPLVGPSGEHLTKAEAQHRHNELREQITSDTENGSTKHLQTKHKRGRDIGMLLIDFPVFLYTMISLLNVDLLKVAQGNLAGIVPMVIAATFALLGTVLLAVTYRAMGRRHRAHKDHNRSVTANGTSRRTVQIEMIALAAVAIAAAAVMAARVIVEGIEADASMPMVIAIAALFALLLMFSCYVNYRSEFDNGSTSTDQLIVLSNQTRGHDHHQADLTNARQAKVEQAGVNTATMLRAIVKAEADAVRTVTDSAHDKAIKIARSYHGQRGGQQIPQPELNTDRLSLAKQQASELAAHQTYLQSQAINPTNISDNDLFQFINQE